MALDTAELIAQAVRGNIGSTGVLTFATAAAASAFGALLAVGPLSRRLMAGPRESWLSDCNPFEKPLNDGTTLLCKDGALVATFILHGMDMATLDNAKRRELMQGRKRWIDAMAGKPVHARCFSIRRRRAIGTGAVPPPGALRDVMERWHAPFEDAFENVHVLALTVPGTQERARDILTELVEATLETLRDYKPELLRHVAESDEGGTSSSAQASPLLSFWNAIWNPASAAATGGADLRTSATRKGSPKLSQRMRADGFETEPRSGLLRFSAGGRERFAYAVGVAEFGEASSDQIVADLVSVNAEVVLLQHFNVEGRDRAEAFVDQRARMGLAGRAGIGAANVKGEFDTVSSMLSPDSPDPQSLVYYQLTVFAFGDTPEEARRAQNEVRLVFRDWRVNPITDTHIASCQWFLQFPTYDDPVRPNALLSQNVAEFANFESVSTGDPHCMWGDGPTLVLPTASGVPFRFIFHDSPARSGEPLGHTVVFGRTGSGKTTVMSLIVAGALRYPDLHVFLFDRFRGLYVFTKAMEGEYISIDSGIAGDGIRQSRLQPLQAEETVENHQHLIMLLNIMSGLQEMKLKPEERAAAEAEIAAIVRDTFHLPARERNLQQLVNAATTANSVVKAALAKWLDAKQLGAYFNGPPAAEKERLALGSRLTTFDMTETFDHPDKAVPAAIGLEIFHRIKRTMREKRVPALIVIDEAPAILRDPGFRAQAMILLREIRKLGGTVVMMFQGPDSMEAIDPEFSQLLRTQTANHIFFRDPGAAANLGAYKKWGLGPREVAFIRRQDPRTDGIPRAMLLKRVATSESVILDVGYDRLGPLRNIFASGNEAVNAAVRLQRGVESGEWLAKYIEEMEDIRARSGS